ncbi:translational machinery protein [Duganella qianjiadongensis]|uniref:Translational machinery protein n=1 Tax=Duganella qianjiadongensis TaxID=2692176 RepID=A0ABW9VK39_9BURK|nr:translational machinery protein [Duganella qianjiadongensis]MYM39687.1 translational machinery protein [Duganella qianjiadongensis]
MSFNHVVAWIDHTEAHVIHFNAEAADSEVIKTHSKHPHLHGKSGSTGVGRAPENKQYFDDVAKALSGSTEILIVGPGHEKLELMKYMLRQHPAVAECVMSVESADHPSDGQLLKYARKYFVKADMMR